MKSNFSKRILALLLTLAMVLTLLPSVFAAGGTSQFTDVEENKFYTEAVAWAMENGITTGKTDTTFAPNLACTRGEVVTFIWRAFNKPAPTSTETKFTDLKDGAFYYDAVLWAVEKGITKGKTTTTFGPNETCTRGQVVTFLWRAAGEPEATKKEHSFTDVKEDAYYYDAMLWAVENGITNGMTATTFVPNGDCTRGHVVTFLYRALADTTDKAELEKTTEEAEELDLSAYTAESAAALQQALDAAKAVLENPDATQEEIDNALAALRAAIDGLAPKSTDFVLSKDLKDGDEVVIYNAGHGLAIRNETDNDWYLLGTEAEIDNENHKVVNPTDDIIWTVGVGEDGTYTFSNGSNMIVCWPSGTYFELTNDANHADAVKEWKLKEADKNTYSYYIYNATLTGQYGPVWLEFYTKNDNTKLSGYSTSEDRLGLENFGFQFYVKGAEWVAPGPGPGPGPGPSEGEYVLAAPKDGDEVVIYNAGNKLAIKNETDNDWYLLGGTVTLNEAEHKITDPDAALVWKVASDANGMMRFTNGDNVITCWPSGNYFELTNNGGHEGGVTDWALKEADAKTYSYYIKSWSLTGQYGPVWLEFYQRNGEMKVSAYATSEDRLNLEAFGFQFYVKGAEYVEPGGGPGPQPGEDKVFVKVTEDLGDWEGTYVIAREKDASTAYVFDGTNDKNENFVEAPLADGKITASTENAIVIEKSGDGYTFKAASGYLNGKIYNDAPANGLVFETAPAVGTIAFADGLPVITAASGTVFRFNNKTYTDASYLWFRFFKTDSSVTTDANTYVELYKLDEGETPVPTVKTAELEKAIAAAKALDAEKYTEESFAAVTEALAAAEAVLAKEDKTQEEVDAAAKALNDAIAALEKLPEEPVEGEFVLTNAIKDGDKVIIYHPASGMAVSNADLSESQTNYRAGVAVTPEDDKIADPEEAIVWTVSEAGGSFIFKDAEGRQLSCTGNNLKLGDENPTWEIREGSIEGTVNIVNVNAPAGSSGDPRAMEWYAKYSEFSCYYLTATDEAFALQLFVKTEGTEKDLEGKIVILHTNDTHGALLGFANAAGLKREYEARGAKVILVDAGDFSQGTTYVSSAKGATAVEVMNEAGYDFVTLGNHEFDFGYAQLKENLSTATFTVLCADVLLKESGESAFQGHAIVEANGIKIGFFGMETPETFTKVNPGLIQEITFPQGEAMYACAQAEVDALKAEGADIIIGIVHLGVDDESEPNRSIDLYRNVEGIDFLIDGHSHTVMTEGPDGEPIQSTGTKASKTMFMNVGYIEIDPTATRKDGRIKNELIPITEETPAEPATAAVAQEIMDKVDAEYGAVFATSEVDLNGDKTPGNRNMETNLGDLITDSMLWGVLKEGSLEVPDENVVAITNGGGIRAWIHKGDVTKNDVNTVLPFGNTVAVVYVKGSELLEALEASTYSTPGAVGGFPQVAGIKYTINTAEEFDKGEQYPDSTYYAPASIKRVTIDEINGKPFDPEATYAVVTNNFCAAGGDTYYVFKNASAQFDTGLPMDEVLMDYIGTELGGVIGSAYAEPQGRITVIEKVEEDIVIGGLEMNTWTTKYGNIYTSCSPARLKEMGFEYGDIITVKFLDKELDLPLVPTFSYVDSGTPGAFCNKNEDGSFGSFLFFAINMGDFTTTYGIATKSTVDGQVVWTANEGVEFPIVVKLELKEKGGYLTEMQIRDINRTNNREDYDDLSDAEFANFRQITTTGMGDHLYRGSSPINPEIGRNTYADKELENAGVTVVMNLADNAESAAAYEGFGDTYYSKQNVTYLNLGVDFFADDFKAGLANGMKFFAANPGTYYVHCTEGKDRAGFVSALLECLMGATYDEVVSDYLTTYKNYYTVVDGEHVALSDEALASIANANIVKTLQRAFDVEDLTTADLAAEAEAYLKEIGLSDDEIAALKANLGDTPAEPEYVYLLTGELKDGDEVVIYNPTNSKALRAELTGNYYLVADDAVPTDGIIPEPAEEIIWTVTKNEDGTYTFRNGENVLAAYVSGNYVDLALDGTDHTINWTLTTGNTENNSFYMYAEGLEGKYGHVWLEFYNGRFSAYTTSDDRVTEAAFGLQFYAKTDKSTIHEHDWVAGTVDPADCTHQEITHYTCSVCNEQKTEVTGEALGHNWGEWDVNKPADCTEKGEQTHTCARCGETETEEIAALGHVDENADGKCDRCGEDMPATSGYAKVKAIAAGDTIIIVNEEAKAELTSVAKIGNNMCGIATTYEEAPAASFTLEVVAGSQTDSYAFKTSEGLYLSWASGNTLTTSAELNDASSWTVTFDEDGNATINNVGTPARVLSYNASSPRFCCYGNMNQKRVQIYALIAE